MLVLRVQVKQCPKITRTPKEHQVGEVFRSVFLHTDFQNVSVHSPDSSDAVNHFLFNLCKSKICVKYNSINESCSRCGFKSLAELEYIDGPGTLFFVKFGIIVT